MSLSHCIAYCILLHIIMFNNVLNKQVLVIFSMDQIKDRKVSLIKHICIHHTHVLKCALVKEILILTSLPLSPSFIKTFSSPSLNFHPNTYRSSACVRSHSQCPTLCDRIDRTPPGSSVCGIFQARILEWVAISFSRGSS